MVLIIFLAVSISINIVYVFISSCKKEKLASEVQLYGLKENPTTTPSAPMVIPHEDRIPRTSWKSLRTFAVPSSAVPPPFPTHQLQPPAFRHPNDEEHVTSHDINDINDSKILRLPNSSIRVALIATVGYVSTLHSTVQNCHSSTRENSQPLTPFSFNNANNNHNDKTKSVPPPH
ncbi:hypothetical protein TSMEX_007700 [Taenia solium]|eukprot:TsM_000725100 transcript=TsM_000725100 gene=TsM_000725100